MAKRNATKSKTALAAKWDAEEDETLRQIWGKIPRKLYEDRIPGRTYGAIEARTKVLGIRVARTNPCSMWTDEEDAIVRKVWGKIPQICYTDELPSRTINAVEHRARQLKLRGKPKPLSQLGPDRPKRARRQPVGDKWTIEAIDLLIRLADDPSSWQAAFPKRTMSAIRSMAHNLGVRPPKTSNPFTPEEERLLRLMVRTRFKLRETRTEKSIANKLNSMTHAELRQNKVMVAVRGAVPAHLPPHIREDVHHTLLLDLMSGEIAFAELAEAAKRTITKTYGPRMFSLDAPLADGSSMTWLDTIDNDHARF